jgi:ferric-dicitrate binding protein FerR (iron transport regulator)
LCFKPDDGGTGNVNLTDKETLELNELCNELVDGNIAPAQREQLSKLLAASDEARKFYVRYAGLSASLFDYAGEMQGGQPENAPESSLPAKGRILHFPRFVMSAFAVAASLVIAAGIWPLMSRDSADAAGDSDAEELAARITGSENCVWAKSPALLQPGAHLQQGQIIALEKGRAEITFDCGAQIVLDGPASLEVNSPWETTLHRGLLHAHVPPEATGFRVTHQSVDVVDLGTEFTMAADEAGSADVYVTKGEVETTPRGASNPAAETITLRKDEGRHFANGHVALLENGAKKYGAFNYPAKLTRFAAPANFVHWSFNETEGPVARAERNGDRADTFELKIAADESTAIEPYRESGRWSNALRLDGRTTAQAACPGISAETPRTIAFWAKVPADAQLADAGSAVGWISKGGGKLGAHSVQIGWNASPSQGPVGALRTECGRAPNIAATNLRDGRWHHVAVVFVPNERGGGKLHVKQYVDGRLEQPGFRHSKKAKRELLYAGAVDAPNDTLVIGRRIGRAGEAHGKFRGSLDELFIADRALTPQEIHRLMLENKTGAADYIAHE